MSKQQGLSSGAALWGVMSLVTTQWGQDEGKNGGERCWQGNCQWKKWSINWCRRCCVTIQVEVVMLLCLMGTASLLITGWLGGLPHLLQVLPNHLGIALLGTWGEKRYGSGLQPKQTVRRGAVHLRKFMLSAEGILRGRPDGTYMLRRRSPKQLVLSFNTSSEEGDQVQHVLFIYEDGCFTDDKGRLGSFHSLQELLASKISKLVMLPLRFVRLSHSSNYVLAEECEGKQSLTAVS
ncbi:unnamed protein product [Chrysoparadoxa australica]